MTLSINKKRLFDQRKKSYLNYSSAKRKILLHYSILPITFQKILNASLVKSEKWRVKSEEVKSKNPERFRIQDFLVHLRVGFRQLTTQNPGPTAYRACGILPCEEKFLALDCTRNVLHKYHPERQIQSQLLSVRSTLGRAKRLLTVGTVHKKRTPISRSSWCTSRDSNPGPTD